MVNKILYIVLLLILFVIVIELFVLSRIQTKPIQKSSSIQNSKEIVSKQPKDSEERTAFFKSGSMFSGVGKIEKDNQQYSHVIGEFSGWENIPNSKDRYMLINHPETKKLLEKVRVSFEPTPLFLNGLNSTKLAVENTKTKEIKDVKQIKDIPVKEVDILFKQNDAVVAIFLPESSETFIAVKDSQNHYCAATIIIRRLNGLNALKVDSKSII